jgi:hypothetical protein
LRDSSAARSPWSLTTCLRRASATRIGGVSFGCAKRSIKPSEMQEENAQSAGTTGAWKLFVFTTQTPLRRIDRAVVQFQTCSVQAQRIATWPRLRSAFCSARTVTSKHNQEFGRVDSGGLSCS